MTDLQPNGSDIPAVARRKLTYREARYVAARINGDDMVHAGRKAGFSEWLCRIAGSAIEKGAVAEALNEAQEILANHALANGLIDATEIHEYLTDAIRARMSDIRNDDHTFKPRSEWPEIWDRMEEAGDVDVEYEKVRSHDGEDTEGLGGWETGSKVVVKVKLKFASRVKLLELAMKHKAVNAMVEQKSGGDLHLHVHSEITAKLQGALQREAKLIDVKPEPE